MKENGGNGGGTGIRTQPKPKTVEEIKSASIERMKGQYLFLRLIQILNIKPLKADVPLSTKWVTITFDGLNYSLTEVLEEALKMIEAFRREKTQL